MADTTLTPDQVVSRGRTIYESGLRERLEPAQVGQFVVINVATGEYEVDADDTIAARRAKDRFGGAPLYAMRIGQTAAYRLGGRFRTSASE